MKTKRKRTPPDPQHRVRPTWTLPRNLVQNVAVRAAAKQQWAEDWVEMALVEMLKREDC